MASNSLMHAIVISPEVVCILELLAAVLTHVLVFALMVVYVMSEIAKMSHIQNA